MNHQTCHLLPLQQRKTHVLSNHSARSISHEPYHSFMKEPLRSNWYINLLFLLSFPNRLLYIDGLWSTNVFLFHSTRWLWSLFSLYVLHSRFSNLLSFFIPFLWFTVGLLSLFSKKVIAINLWTRKLVFFHHFHSMICRYGQVHWNDFINFSGKFFHALKRAILFIFHKLLAIYNPSYPGISFQTSFSIIRKLKPFIRPAGFAYKPTW